MSNQACSINFSSTSKSSHQCSAEKEGEFIVYRCPLCPEYERRIHSKTGVMEVSGNIGNPHSHHGTYVKAGLDYEGGVNPN